MHSQFLYLIYKITMSIIAVSIFKRDSVRNRQKILLPIFSDTA